MTGSTPAATRLLGALRAADGDVRPGGSVGRAR